MQPQPTTWADVWLYDIVIGNDGQEWKVIAEKTVEDVTWLKIRSRAGEELAIRRPDPTTPVTAMRYTEAEAAATIRATFPGSQLIRIEDYIR